MCGLLNKTSGPESADVLAEDVTVFTNDGDDIPTRDEVGRRSKVEYDVDNAHETMHA